MYENNGVIDMYESNGVIYMYESNKYLKFSVDCIRKLYDCFGGEVLVPLHNGLKYPKFRKWQSKFFSLQDFLASDVSGVGIRVNNAIDLVCIDVDCKKVGKDKVRQLLLEWCAGRAVYLEESPNGFHIFLKVSGRDEFISMVRDVFGSRFVADGVEVFPDCESRQVVVYPSVVEQGRYIPLLGELWKVGYVDVVDIFELFAKLRSIFGEKKVVCRARKKSNRSKLANIELCNDIYSEFLVRPKFRRIRQFLYKLEQVVFKDKELFLDLLVKFGIVVEGENDCAYRIRSPLVDDGRYADCYIFKDRAIMYDFHFYESFQVFPFLILTDVRKFVEWCYRKIPQLIDSYMVYVKKIMSRDDLEWFFEFIVSSDVKTIIFSRLREVYSKLGRFDKGKLKKWFLRGEFGRALKFVDRKAVELFVKPEILVSKFRKFLRLKYALSGTISINKKKAERLSKYFRISYPLFEAGLKGIGFKYYRKHKKYVRPCRLAREQLCEFLEFAASSVFAKEIMSKDKVLYDDDFSYNDFVSICSALSGLCEI